MSKTQKTMKSLDGVEIEITIENGCGSIITNIDKVLGIKRNSKHGFAIDIVESLMLAHAVNGINIASLEYLNGLDTMLEAWANQE